MLIIGIVAGVLSIGIRLAIAYLIVNIVTLSADVTIGVRDMVVTFIIGAALGIIAMFGAHKIHK